jgi:hypothetical protein
MMIKIVKLSPWHEMTIESGTTPQNAIALMESMIEALKKVEPEHDGGLTISQFIQNDNNILHTNKRPTG